MNSYIRLLTHLVWLWGVLMCTASWAGGWRGCPPLVNEYSEHEFLAACREGHRGAVRYFLGQDHFDINGLYVGGPQRQPKTGLDLAAGFGHNHIVEILLDNKADPNKAGYRGLTPLINAANAGHLSVVDTLLGKGAWVNSALESDGSTALHHAAQNGYHRIVRKLLEYGADPVSRRRLGLFTYTALDLAKRHRPWLKNENPTSERHYGYTQTLLSAAMQNWKYQSKTRQGVQSAQKSRYKKSFYGILKGASCEEMQPLMNSVAALTVAEKRS